MQKIGILSLMAVLLVGIVGFIGLSSEQTGQSVILDRYCECHLIQHDYYGNVVGENIQNIRVQTSEAHTDSACNNRCQIYYGRGMAQQNSVWGQAK